MELKDFIFVATIIAIYIICILAAYILPSEAETIFNYGKSAAWMIVALEIGYLINKNFRR